MVVGWAGDGQVLEERGLHRTYSNVLARYRGMEVDNSPRLVENIHPVAQHLHQVSVSHLADLDLLVVGHVVLGDVSGKGQHLHVHHEGLLEQGV